MMPTVKSPNRIWGTAIILILAMIGCGAGIVALSNQDAKIEVRRTRLANIDAAIREALRTAKDTLNKKFLDDESANTAGSQRTLDTRAVRQLLEKQTRAFNFCEEEVSALNNQRRQNEIVVYDLMEGVNECTILMVVGAILGLYAVFWLQRYG